MIIGNVLALIIIGAAALWLAVFLSYWKGRDDGVKAERDRWTHSLKDKL